MVTGLRDVTLRVDGGGALTTATVAALGAACDEAENIAESSPQASAFVILRASGLPGPDASRGLPVALVSKWERALRRLERLPAVTIAVADGDCGGVALDALLTADYRIMCAGARLVLPAVGGATWPGMALYRLARQAQGNATARRAVLFGAPIAAADAQALGLVDDVTDDADDALANALAVAGPLPGAELAIRRQLMLEAVTTTFEDALGVHLAACDRALRAAGAVPPGAE